jgi:hypothetical protein
MIDGLLKLNAPTDPNPMEAAGLLLAPRDELSKFQAVRVLAAFAAVNEAAAMAAIQASFLIFIEQCWFVFFGWIESDSVVKRHYPFPCYE